MATVISNLRSIKPRSTNFISTTVRVYNRVFKDKTTGLDKTVSRTETTYSNSAANSPVTMHCVRNNASQDQLSFVFPFTPQQIQYGNIGPELMEISRPGKMPLVAFSKFKSRQLSVKFLIAVPSDGLFTSIDDSLELLFDMANLARPVFFTGMDKQISNPLGSTDASRNIFWSIQDLNFSSIRRNEANQITAAEANMTLIENVNPNIVVADLPVITYNEKIIIPRKTGTNPEGNLLSYTSVRNKEVYSDNIFGP
jgi:hypothetical protein